MANPFKQLHIKSAVKGSSKFDLSSHHLTTLDFGQIVPIFVQHEVMPGDSFNVKQNLFSRIAPLAVPTYGNLFLKTATFFIPYHQVAYDVETWLSGDKFINGKVAETRTMPFASLMGFFLNGNGHTPFVSRDPSMSNLNELKSVDNSLVKSVSSSSQAFDFTIVFDTGSVSSALFFRFTSKGRYFYKILRSLGYGFFEGMEITKIESSSTFDWDLQLNILPLLSFFKAYNDWMSQSAIYNQSVLSSSLQDIRYNNIDPRAPKADVYEGYLNVFFDNLLLQYESNYFTTAWESPNEIIQGQSYNNNETSPSKGLQSLEDELSDHISLDSSYNVTMNHEVDNSSVYSSIGLRFLSAFDKFLRRNNYSGARSVEKLLSRFGIKTEDYRNEFAILIDTSKSILQIGDVTNVTDTGDINRPLGSYAGKGVVSGDNAYSFKSSDFGTLITFAWLQPDVQYYHGIDRTILKKSVADFYQPEYDSLDAMPIAQCELNSNPRSMGIDPDSLRPLDVFGFTERYNELRQGKNRVTGDFALDFDMHSWHFGMESDYIRGLNAKAQDPSIISQPQTNSQFDRIFVDDTDTAEDMRDHFYLTCYFDVNAHRNMLSISDVANLGEGSLDIQRNGTQLS